MAQLLVDVVAGHIDAAVAQIADLAPQLLSSAPALPSVVPYARCVLHADAQGEVLLMHWRQGAVSAIHDHGEAAGLVVALQGDFVEQTVELTASGPKVTGKRTMPATQGARLDVAQGDFHVMCAPRGGISLHIYTPTPRVMRVADPELRTIWIVGEGHGAWLPVEPALVKGKLPWPA
ncbi:MAG TPA: cysteine dioxygenase family protein [Kofleriaceae bacterium]|nr:cysteine dioxygenase family protein [Kofleriaceae bacterium]